MSDESDYLLKALALIRANFHIDPKTLSDEEFGMLFSQAIWLESWRLKNLAEMVTKLFS